MIGPRSQAPVLRQLRDEGRHRCLAWPTSTGATRKQQPACLANVDEAPVYLILGRQYKEAPAGTGVSQGNRILILIGTSSPKTRITAVEWKTPERSHLRSQATSGVFAV